MEFFHMTCGKIPYQFKISVEYFHINWLIGMEYFHINNLN